jgi:hypothetical protein
MKRSSTPKACGAVDQLTSRRLSPVIRPESDLRLSAPRPPTPICRLQHHEGVRAERRQWRVARAAVDSASEMIGRQSEPF